MSHLSRIFEEAPIRVQNRNGFDLSHTHAGTSKCGQLVPVLTKLLAPNSTISLGVQAECNLPPLVAPFYGKIDFAIEGFIVPCSILYGGWKQFISNNEEALFPASQTVITSGSTGNTIYTGATVTTAAGQVPSLKKGYALPYFDFWKVYGTNLGNARTLFSSNDNIYDYMGANYRGVPTSESLPMTMLAGLAYHKICDVFYRNTKLTRTWFAVNSTIGSSSTAQLASPVTFGHNVALIWHSFYTDSQIIDSNVSWVSSSAEFSTNEDFYFPDGTSFFSTRQRNWQRDYFTSAVASPQQGGASVLQFSVDISDTANTNGSFTINALRMANSLQKFLETNNLSGDYAEMSRNRWGVRPIDADFEEPHYLGRVVIPVYQKTVEKQDALGAGEASDAGSNIFTSDGYLGSQAANAYANGEGSICDNFNVTCWSYLMCLASIYPHASYNYGINRELTMTKLGDYPAPELQSVGMEEIKQYELMYTLASGSTTNSTFGYIPRYSRFKYMDDRVSGELRPQKTMAQYSLQRTFSTQPQLGTDFVTIPTNALDNILTVSTDVLKFTCWWEIYFNFHVVMPLADFCIPTLGELQDTHEIKTTVGGSRL